MRATILLQAALAMLLASAATAAPAQRATLVTAGRVHTMDARQPHAEAFAYDDAGRILPLRHYGVKVISIANLVEDGQALTWRGPILHGTLTQLLKQTVWGELDYLIVDLPPGTGDVQLSLAQLVPLTGAVVVTTPQDVALLDVRRAYTCLLYTSPSPRDS